MNYLVQILHIPKEKPLGEAIRAASFFPLRQKGFYMSTDEAVMEIREKQAFWSGVVRGVIGSAVFFVGLVTLIYYVVQIVEAVK